jgi:hypothetical protein
MGGVVRSERPRLGSGLKICDAKFIWKSFKEILNCVITILISDMPLTAGWVLYAQSKDCWLGFVCPIKTQQKFSIVTRIILISSITIKHTFVVC